LFFFIALCIKYFLVLCENVVNIIVYSLSNICEDDAKLQFKSMFFGLSQSTTAGSQTSQPPPVVLAADSEED